MPRSPGIIMQYKIGHSVVSMPEMIGLRKFQEPAMVYVTVQSHERWFPRSGSSFALFRCGQRITKIFTAVTL
jgi:hypothetical protein